MSRMNRTAIWGEGLESIGSTTKNRKAWCKEKGVPLEAAFRRVNVGKWPFERAVNEPLKTRRSNSFGMNANPAAKAQTERIKSFFEREYGDHGTTRR